MNRLLFRGALATCLSLTLMIRLGAQEAPRPAATMAERIEAALATQGYARLVDDASIRARLRKLVWFRFDGCAEPAVIAPFNISLDMRAYLSAGGTGTYRTQVQYHDHIRDDQQKALMMLSLFEQRLRHTFGIAEFRPDHTALVLAVPPDCTVPADIDLSGFWRLSQEDARA